MRQGAASATMLSKSAPHESFRVRIAIGVRRSVAPFQSKLVCTHPLKLDEELFIELHPALRIGINFHHPALYSVRIELLIPRGVQRVGEISTFAVTADLNHLWTAI